MSLTSLFRRAGQTFMVLAVLALSGCALVRVPGSRSSAEAAQRKLAATQASLQRFADEFMSRTVAALAEYERRVGTPDARTQVLNWKLPVVSSAVGLASGPNPSANVIDLITLAAVTRRAVEELHASSDTPEALQPWLDASRALEAEAWALGKGVFPPDQLQELNSTIERWWLASPDARSAFFARPQELGRFIQESAVTTGRGASIFSLVGLDPTAGFDPAVREVIRTRLFAERTLFTAQRMPFLLRWHVELLSDQILRQSQVALALTNTASLAESVERLSRVAESAGLTAAQLPDRLTAERVAILAALELQEGRLRELSAEVSRTLAAGEKMSTSLNTTLVTFDALMKRFGVGEPRNTAPGTNSTPFNILDYATTAGQLAVTADKLNELFREAGRTLDSPALDRRLQELVAVTEHARADAKSLLNHVFLLGVGLVLIILASALAYRWLGPRLARRAESGAE